MSFACGGLFLFEENKSLAKSKVMQKGYQKFIFLSNKKGSFYRVFTACKMNLAEDAASINKADSILFLLK